MIREKYKNLKLFIENFTNSSNSIQSSNSEKYSDDDKSLDDYISKHKIKFFNDSDNSDNNDDNNDDNNKSVNEYFISGLSRKLNNNKDKVEFRWEISI